VRGVKLDYKVRALVTKVHKVADVLDGLERHVDGLEAKALDPEAETLLARDSWQLVGYNFGKSKCSHSFFLIHAGSNLSTDDVYYIGIRKICVRRCPSFSSSTTTFTARAHPAWLDDGLARSASSAAR
jgi:hypothetical protein